MREKNLVKELNMNALKSLNDTLKLENDSSGASILEHKTRITNLEADLTSYELLAAKSELTIQSLQLSNNDLMQRVSELDSDIQ